jgi:hypothetical protein
LPSNWLWHSRKHGVRVRAERIIHTNAYFGIFRLDGASETVGAAVVDRLAKDYPEVHSNEHWQVFAPIPHYPIWPHEPVELVTASQAKLAGSIGDILRMLIDEVINDHNQHAPM